MHIAIKITIDNILTLNPIYVDNLMHLRANAHVVLRLMEFVVDLDAGHLVLMELTVMEILM